MVFSLLQRNKKEKLTEIKAGSRTIFPERFFIQYLPFFSCKSYDIITDYFAECEIGVK